MKASFCSNVFINDEIPGAVKHLKTLGYQGVEFWHQFLAATDIVKLKKYIDGIGICASQICPYFNVTGTEWELKETFLQAEEYVRYARSLDCNLIRVFTGNVSSREADAKTFDQAVEGLRTICDIGKGLFFVLETHDGSLMDTGYATLKLLGKVKRDNLRVNLQIPLDEGKEDVYESARMLGEYVIHIHAHNWIGGWPNLTYLDNGDVDFKKFIGILASKGFDGYISIEHGNHSGKKDPYEVAEHEIEYLKRVIFEEQ